MEEVIQFVESKEPGKRSAKRLLDSHAVGAISRYNRSKKDEIKACHYCGKGVMTSVRCHRSEQLNVQHTDMSANTATNATTSSPYVAAGQLGERTVKTTQRRHSSPSVP